MERPQVKARPAAAAAAAAAAALALFNYLLNNRLFPVSSLSSFFA